LLANRPALEQPGSHRGRSPLLRECLLQVPDTSPSRPVGASLLANRPALEQPGRHRGRSPLLRECLLQVPDTSPSRPVGASLLANHPALEQPGSHRGRSPLLRECLLQVPDTSPALPVGASLLANRPTLEQRGRHRGRSPLVRDTSELGLSLTLALSQGQRGPFGAGRNLRVSRLGLPPLPEGRVGVRGEDTATDYPEKTVAPTPGSACG